MPAPGTAKTKEISVKLANDQANFKWQMVFNTYSLDRLPTGCLARFAWVAQGTAAEILPVFISDEGIDQLWKTSQKYLNTFGDVEARPSDVLPAVRQFSPMFSNHIRLAFSGANAEIGFFGVPMHATASAARGDGAPNIEVHLVQVALLYSDLLTHRQFVMSLLKEKREA